MIDYVSFLLTKVYNSKAIPNSCIEVAFCKTVLDIKFHFPNLSEEEIRQRIVSNSNELAVFLFRLGSELHKQKLEGQKWQVHWLLKELCACEIYFNNSIDEGFYVVHGVGTVIGSRNIIGKGFKIHHGCTIGHKKNGEGNGNVIGDYVTMYCNASVIGDLHIGNNIIIGAHVLVTKDLADDVIITSVSSHKSKGIHK